MNRNRCISRSIIGIAMVIGLGGAGFASASAQSGGAPLDLPCATGVTVEALGQALPANAGGQALVAVRLTIAPGGGIGPHTHPGTLTVWVDSGSLSLTLLEDADMIVSRASVDGTPVPGEPLVANEEVVLNSGDGFVEGPMLHEAWNRSTEPTVVLLSGLVDPAKPLVQCGEGGM